MRTGPRSLVLLLALLGAGLCVALLFRTRTALHQIDTGQRDKALTLARTVAGAARGIVRYGPDREGRLEAALAEVAGEPGVLSVALVTNEGVPVVEIGGPTPAVVAGKPLASEWILDDRERPVAVVPFDMPGACLVSGCKACAGCPACSTGPQRLGPGRYGLVLCLDGTPTAELRAHVFTEAVVLGAIVLLLAAVAWLLLRSVRLQQRLALRVTAEQQKRESLESLGILAAGLAHEIRNPLGAIRGYAQLLHERAPDDAARDQTGVMLRELDRVAERLEEFLSFARQRRPNAHPVDIAQLADDVVRLLEPDARSAGVALRQSGGGPVRVEADASQLKEALTNLVLNALQACRDGDTVTVSVVREDACAVVRVADTGEGIADGDLPRIFEPYFTTRPRGTGLGLAISRRIAEGHDGTLTVESQPGKGTTARLALPWERARVQAEGST